MSAKTVADKLLIKADTTLWTSHPDRLDLIHPYPMAHGRWRERRRRPSPWSSPTTPTPSGSCWPPTLSS